VIPTLLSALAIVDAAFAGFRAAAGRNARIFKRRYYQTAMLGGAAAGAGLVLVLAAATMAVLAVSRHPASEYAQLVRIGGRMLRVLGVYSALVMAALLVYGTARAELRTLATVAILGPFTLIRPAVVVAATISGLSGGATAPSAALTVVASAAVLALGRGLDWWHGRAFSGR
jgi:hypothetical protein